MIIRFLKDCPTAGRKAGDEWEVQDAKIGRAYIEAGYAEEGKSAEGDLFAELTRTVQSSLEALRTDVRNQVAEIGQSVSRGFQGAAERFRPQVSADESEDEKLARSGGFRNIAHFAATIQREGREAPSLIRGDTLLGRYNAAVEKIALSRAVASPDGMYETSEPDGGALVPPDFTTQIWERVYGQERLLSRTNHYTISGNTFRMPRNTETSRVDGSRWGGVLGYWENEAQQLPGSRPKFDHIDLRLKKLTILMYVTNELLTDSATALEQYIGRLAPQEIEFKSINALINGTAGQPLGLLNDPALVTIPKESGQASQTILWANIQKLYNTIWSGVRGEMIWLYNQEIEPQLWSMYLPIGTSYGVPVFLPAGSTYFGAGAEKPFATLFGRPAYAIEQCPGLGQVGDIIGVSLREYLTISKGSVQSSMSIHLKFDYDESVFKWIWRMDGQGLWKAPLTPYKSNLSKQYSYVAALQAR